VDFAGLIVAADDGVRPELEQQGTRVFGVISPNSHLDFLTLRWNEGTLAEYVLAFQDHVVVKPPNITMAEAAG